MADALLSVEPYVGQDFYVPSFRIVIGSKDVDSTHDIMSVTYADSLAAIDSFDMVVNNWDAGAEELDQRAFKYSDKDTFDPWKDVEVFMGYIRNGQDERRRMLVGEITTVAPNFPAGGGSTLTVRGLNLLHRFRTKQDTKPFFDKKDSQIAQLLVDEIAADIKKKVPKLALKLDSQEIENNKKTEQSIPYLLMNNQYPIVFLMERARRIGYELSLEEAPRGSERKVTLHFRPTSEVKTPTYILEWGKSLISFQPTLQTANQVSEVTVRGWDPQAKRKFEATVKRSDLTNTGVVNPSDLAVNEPALSQKLEVVVDHPIQNKAEADELAKKTLRQLAQGLVEAKGKTIGLPDLRSGAKIDVRGLGERFSGTYLVTSTTHTIGEAGYTTDFSARMEQRLGRST